MQSAGKLETPPVSFGSIKDYFLLLKPRVMSLVVFTGFAGLFLAPNHIHPFLAAVAIFAIALGSGASGAINMWLERDIDSKMKRTRNRPLPMNRLDSDTALEFAIIAAAASVVIMSVAINFVAALLLLVAILYYVFVYTIWLKPRTPQNIVIGGAAGAFPPLIGWAAVTGDISLMPAILFTITFLWTPPHFWALALYRNNDYQNAGIPMLPVVAGPRATTKQMLIYTFLLTFVSMAPVALGYSRVFYCVTAIIMNTIFIWHAIKVHNNPVEQYAKPMFKFSILYLFVIFSSLIIDKIILELL